MLKSTVDRRMEISFVMNFGFFVVVESPRTLEFDVLIFVDVRDLPSCDMFDLPFIAAAAPEWILAGKLG